MPTYTARAHAPYTAEQLFDLAVDVARYPEFLPWIVAARVLHHTDRAMAAVLTMRTGPLAKTFLTEAKLDHPHVIEIDSSDPIFDRFRQTWTFKAAATGGTMIAYHVDLRLRSRLLQMLIGRLFRNRADDTVLAFRHRADHLYRPHHR